jgi:tetratricopeptide (TPR) repeat protein/TolB-like protein
MMLRPRALIAMALLAGVIAVALTLPGTRTRLRDALAAMRMLPEQRVAVLPFASVSSGTGDQAFCDGLLDVVTSGLARLSEKRDRVWVAPVADIREQRIATITEAQRGVGANLAFSGVIERRGDHVILSLDLADARTGRTLRSERIDDAMSDVAMFEQRIVLVFARMLGIRPEPRELDPLAAGRTRSPEAYEKYLRAIGYLQYYVREENVDAAMVLLEEAIEQDPEYSSAHAALGEACWRKCEATWDTVWVRRAEGSCTRALALDSDLPEARVTLGLIRVGQGRFEEAVAELEFALVLDPTSAAAEHELARAFLGLDRTDEALATCKKAIELRPTYWAGYNLLGNIYYSLGRYEESAAQYFHVISLAPDNAIAYANLGGAYDGMGRLDDACWACEKSLAITPNFRAYNNLGAFHYKKREYADAAAMFELALLYDDRDYRVWGNLADAYRQLGKTELSEDRYRVAIEKAERFRTVNERDPAIVTHLAGYYMTQAEFGRTEQLLDSAIALAPSDVPVLKDAIRVYEMLGLRRKALDVASLLLELGFREWIEADSDLQELILDERYKRMVDEMQR